MGQTPTIYGRLKINNKYDSIYEDLQGNTMARFKHETFAYATEQTHTDYKSIYLYNGYARTAKAEIPAGSKYLELTFASKADADAWDVASEQIDNVHVEIPWLYRDFDKKWAPVANDHVTKRIYIIKDVRRKT
jgi:hypothetical protein